MVSTDKSESISLRIAAFLNYPNLSPKMTYNMFVLVNTFCGKHNAAGLLNILNVHYLQNVGGQHSSLVLCNFLKFHGHIMSA